MELTQNPSCKSFKPKPFNLKFTRSRTSEYKFLGSLITDFYLEIGTAALVKITN